MGSLAGFQLNRSTGQRQRADAKQNGAMAPRSRPREKLGEKLAVGLQRTASTGRFRPLLEPTASESGFAEGTLDLESDVWADSAEPQQGHGKFMRLLVHAARRGHLFHIQTPPRSVMRFHYIRLLLLGEGLAMAASPSLRQLLQAKTPRSMLGRNLEEAVAEAVAGISSVDTGLLLELVERQISMGREADSRNTLIRDTIGSTFNLFFNWLAFLIAGDKLARHNRMSRQSVLQELVIEYDEYVVDHVLPMTVDWCFQGHDHSNDRPVEDSELALMAEILKSLRRYVHRTMADIVTRYEAELYARDTNLDSKDVLHVLWYIQRTSTLDVWGQGVWVLDVEAPIATMRRKGSQLTETGQEAKKPASILRALSAQRLDVEGQLTASVVSTPDFVEVTINIANIMCRVANASWDEDCFGHFPSALSLFVTPLTCCALFSVNKSTANKVFKINMTEQLQVALGIGVSALMQGVVGAGVGSGGFLGTTSAPWEFEQLEEGENGGSFNWSLTSLEGKPFNRLNPFIGHKKTSVLRFGRRPPSNPLLGLPFGSDGSVVFSEEEYAEGLKWRFPKEVEGTAVAWSVQGSVDTTIISKKGYWETRTLYFEHVVEQALIPDPEEPEKKDKKKKKKKAK